jgi:hypothetical protein
MTLIALYAFTMDATDLHGCGIMAPKRYLSKLQSAKLAK